MIHLDNMIKKETGSGIGVVIYGIVIMLVLSLVSINILNAKIIQDGYDRLRDSVEAAAAGSVLHIALGNQETHEKNNITNKSTYQVNYDPWLQLALGFLMSSDSNSGYAGSALDGNNTIANDYIKFDHKRVVTHTMRVLQDGVLKSTDKITNSSKYKIKMVFLEPAYDSNLNKSIDVVIYDNNESMYKNDLTPDDDFRGSSASAVGDDLIANVESIINNKLSGVKINLQANAGLVEALKTRPYYFIIVEDFPLPTLFTDTNDDNLFKSIGQIADEHVTMFALQGANTKRIIAEEDKGIK